MSRRTRATALVLAVTGALVMAGPAWAGTIRYDIQPSDQYTVTDNDTGIAKVVWNGCLVVGQNGTINFNVVVNTTQGGQANWRIIKDDAPIVNGTFTPNPLTLDQGKDQSVPTTLSFNISAASGSAVDFRAKLDPESGEGLGEGPGIMVRVPCVVESQPSPAPASEAAQPAATCIAAPTRVSLRAKQRGQVRVQVKKDGQSIQGSLVTITGPGFRKRLHTGGAGLAIFKVTPSRKGELVIQADVCPGSERFAVLGARVAGRQGASPRAVVSPRFTG
jgi:hypothetical protein